MSYDNTAYIVRKVKNGVLYRIFSYRVKITRCLVQYQKLGLA